jgi:hypothetical protein
MPFATHQDVGTSLMGYEKKAPDVPKSHLANVAKARKLGAPKDLASGMVQGKKSFDAAGYKPNADMAYINSGGYGGAM